MPEHVPGPDLSSEASNYSALNPNKPELEKPDPTPISHELAAGVGATVVGSSVDTGPDLSSEASNYSALNPNKPETPVTAEESGTTAGEHDENITVADSAQVRTDQRSDLSDSDAAIPQGPGVIEQQDPGPSDRGDEIATKPERIKGEENGATSSEQELKPTDERTVDLAFLMITDPGNIKKEFAPELVQIVEEYSGDGSFDITKAREAARKELEDEFGIDKVGACFKALEGASNDPHETRSVGQIVAEYLNHPDAQTSQDPGPSDRGDESAIKPKGIEDEGEPKKPEVLNDSNDYVNMNDLGDLLEFIWDGSQDENEYMRETIINKFTGDGAQTVDEARAKAIFYLADAIGQDGVYAVFKDIFTNQNSPSTELGLERFVKYAGLLDTVDGSGIKTLGSIRGVQVEEDDEYPMCEAPDLSNPEDVEDFMEYLRKI